MNETLTNVAVLMGGTSSEREVSLKSGAAVSRGLSQAGYVVTDIDVTAHDVRIGGSVEGVFIALHGEFGEDGQMQERLEDLGIPYTGSGPSASRAAFDKKISKRIFSEHGIPTPPYVVLRRGDVPDMPLPAVVKPECQGSTIGVHKIERNEDWEEALEDAFRYGEEVLVESYIAGRELTVGIVGETPLPVLEIRAPSGWYDYRAKYQSGVTEYLVPAPISEKETREAQDAAFQAFKALGCRGFARADMRLSEKGEVFVLELNTIPGFTETSLLPKAAAEAGMSFPSLCDGIMRMARTESGAGVRSRPRAVAPPGT